MSDQPTQASGLIEIAVLDDDLDFRNYIEDLLRDEGKYSVRSFGDENTLFASIQDRVPEIVLLDMKMGSTSGETVVEDLLSRWPELCIIVVTGYPSLESMRATFKLRVFDYLAKPFSIQQLRQTLQNAIEQFGLGSTPQEKLRKRLGHSIKLLRVERNWSLKELATAAKLSVSQISSIERGTNLPSVESLLAISRAFNRKPSELLASIDF
jgi:DNA-binding NtrC family response regulator